MLFSCAAFSFVAFLEQVPVLFVEGNLGLDALFLRRIQLCHIQLIAQQTEGSHIKAAVQRGEAQGLVIGRGAHMAAHCSLRIAKAGPGLYLAAFPGVGVVAEPDLGHITQNAQIKPVAAAGAALKQHIRVTYSHRFQHLIQPHRPDVSEAALFRQRRTEPVAVVAVHIPFHIADGGVRVTYSHRFQHLIQPHRPDVSEAALFRQRRTEPVAVVAVHIPFHIADGGGVQQMVQLVNEVLAHLFPAEVQHQLIPAKAGADSRRGDRPVRMGFIEGAVHTDHFRLHPDAEGKVSVFQLISKTSLTPGEETAQSGWVS